MTGPTNPHDDPKRTAQFTPLEPAETVDQRTTDHITPPIESTVDHITNNPDFSLGQARAQDQHNIDTGTYDPDRTGSYAPPQRVAMFRKVDGYEILSKLGQGGMGVVYKAREERLNRIVALKMILSGPEASPQILQRFQTEAEAVAKLQHPNIVQIFAIGESEGNPYFSLEFVPGTTLAEKVGKEPQDAKYSAGMVETLARAMEFAHNAKIIHRDLKPANVLLTSDGVPKVADFGLAKELEEDHGQTNTGAIMGTPSYMSPEQASGTDHVGPSTDIYALGAILYDLLTGRPPFAGTTKWNTLEMVRKMEPIPPGTLTSTVPKDLDTICLKCLQKEPAKRYVTALELAEDLRRFLDGRAILARPISSIEKAWRWAKRNPVVAGLSTLFLITVIGFSIVSWILKVRADESAALANEKTRLATTAQLEEAKQRGLAEAASDEEKEQRKVAMERMDTSMKSLRLFLLEIQDILRTHPNGRVLREKFVKLTLTELDAAKKLALSTTLVDRTEVTALGRLGQLLLEQNRPEDADDVYAKIEEILLKLRVKEPNDPVFVRALAAMRNSRADVAIRLGDVRKADKLYREALTIREQWAKMPSNAIPTKHPAAAPLSVAESHYLIAQCALRLGDPAQAMEHLNTAVALYQQLPKDLLRQNDVQQALANMQLRKATYLFHLGKTDEAAKVIESFAQACLTRLKANNSPARRKDVAIAAMMAAEHTIRSNGNPNLAWSGMLQALQIFQEPLKIDPLLFAERREVAQLHFRLGITAQRLSGLCATLGTSFVQGLVEEHFAKALALREDLAKDGQRDTLSQYDLSISLARAGRITEAEKIVDAFLKQSPTDPEVRWFSANTLAMATGKPADVERCHEKALGLLEALVADGWKDDVIVRTEPTLDAIRNQPRFAKLTAAIQAKK